MNDPEMTEVKGRVRKETILVNYKIKCIHKTLPRSSGRKVGLTGPPQGKYGRNTTIVMSSMYFFILSHYYKYILYLDTNVYILFKDFPTCTL